MVNEKSRRRREKGVMEGGVVLVLACIWVWNPSSANANTDPSDVLDLNALYSSLNSATQLTGWTSNSGDPCGQSWLGITCSGSAVIAIKLSGMGLTGTLGYMMTNMTSLTELDLSNNNLGGGNQIPYNLPPNLQRLDLAGNQFSGSVPYSISQIIALKYLNLAHNQLQGSLSDMFSKHSNLTLLDLSFNSLTGDLPQSFNTLSSLTTLYLQNNQLTGPIDVLASLPLEDLNVANNRFTGWIPYQLMKINNLQTEGNSWSSGPAPPPPPYMPPPPSRRTSPDQHSGGENSPSNGVRSGDGSRSVNDGGRNSGIGGGGIAGIIISILAIGGIVAFFFIKRKTWKSLKKENQLSPTTGEAGARVGCSITASNKCKPPWWKIVFGVTAADFADREQCEEREMASCLTVSRKACIQFVKEKCLPPFRDARISTVDLLGTSQLVFCGYENSESLLNAESLESKPSTLRKKDFLESFKNNVEAATYRGSALLKSSSVESSQLTETD